jgi:hypothetical protein
MVKSFRSIISDESGQAMTEYVIITMGVCIPMMVFLNSDVLSIFPGGIYKGIYLFLRGLIINACLPIP